MSEKKFKAGDRVRIFPSEEALADLEGLRKRVGFAAVVDERSSTDPGLTHLKPESERPDGNGMRGFYWDTEELELQSAADHVFKKGDRVLLVNDGNPYLDIEAIGGNQ